MVLPDNVYAYKRAEKAFKEKNHQTQYKFKY